MKRFFLYPLRGTINLIIILLATLLSSFGIYFAALFAYLMPTKKLRQLGNRFLQRFPVYWIDMIGLCFSLFSKKKQIRYSGPSDLTKEKPYVLICNHTSWIDILILSHAIHRKSPVIKFFMKKQLIWSLPLAGFATWLLKYPFMARHTKEQIRKRPELKAKDLETTKKACQTFIDYPATIMNYVEGTRFTEDKRVKKNSPFRYLLKPKAAGIAIVMHELQHNLAGIIDATLCYKPTPLSFWQFCCGNFEKIICEYEVLPITDDLIGDYMGNREFRKQIQAWLNQRWQLKDSRLRSLKT